MCGANAASDGTCGANERVVSGGTIKYVGTCIAGENIVKCRTRQVFNAGEGVTLRIAA